MTHVPLKITAAVAEVTANYHQLLSFRQKHQLLLSEYDELIERYNESVRSTKALVKDNESILGDGVDGFSIIRQRAIDPDLIMALVPNWEPYVTEAMVRTVDRKAWDRDVAAGIIPQAFVEQVELPGTIAVRSPPEVGSFTPTKPKGKRR